MPLSHVNKKNKKLTVAIIGAGKMGQVIASCVRERAQAVHLWDVDASKIPSGSLSLEVTLKKADVVFVCVPANAVRDASMRVISGIGRRTTIITIAKGIEEATGFTMAELLADVLKKHHHGFALLVGPMLADELARGQPAYGVLAGLNKVAYRRMAQLFENSQIRLAYSADARGVAYASVLKNIYALGLGIVAGLELGKNVQGWFVTQALAEMRIILNKCQAHPNTAESLAGLGDFITTGFSEQSRNYTVGKALANGEYGKASEGSRSLPLIWKKLGATTKKLPLLSDIYSVVIKKEHAREVIANW